jgi:hypothetical protein
MSATMSETDLTATAVADGKRPDRRHAHAIGMILIEEGLLHSNDLGAV